MVNEFERRFARHRDELEWLFMELYDDRDALHPAREGLRLAADREAVAGDLPVKMLLGARSEGGSRGDAPCRVQGRRP